MSLFSTLYVIAIYAGIVAACASGILIPFIVHLNPGPGHPGPGKSPTSNSISTQQS